MHKARTSAGISALLIGLSLVLTFTYTALGDDTFAELEVSQDGSTSNDGWQDADEWMMRVGAGYSGIAGDSGRFRQDRFTDSPLVGGIEELRYEGEDLDVFLRAYALNDLAFEAHYLQEDHYRIDVALERYRYYADGSRDAWMPGDFGLSSTLADFDDGNLFLDRTNLTLEAQLLLPDVPNILVGWHYARVEGEDVLLWGGLAQVTGPPDVRARSIPAVHEVDTTSNTFYVEVPFTIHDKYNVRFRQEYERTRGNETSSASAFTDGVLAETLTHIDDLKSDAWRTRIDVDSFLSDDVYASAGYYRDATDNTSARTVLRSGPMPSGGRAQQFIDTLVRVERERHVAAFGVVLLDRPQALRVNTHFRVEYAETDGRHTGQETPFMGVLAPVLNATDTKELRLSEAVGLVSQALPHTTISAEGEWEQRYIDTDETIRNVFSRTAEINRINQEYTIRVTNRPRMDVKLMTSYRYADDSEDYTELFNVDPTSYPGFLGDREQQGHKVTVKGDWRFLPAWTGSMQYQYVTEDIEYAAQGTPGQSLRVNRISTSVLGSLKPGVTCTAMGMYERYRLRTPTNIQPSMPPINWAIGTSAYDYEYDSYIGLLSLHKVISDVWSATCSYQHTENNGTDVNNRLDEFWFGSKYTLAENTVLYVRYQYFDFRDQLGNGFDDYSGHGVSVSVAFRF